MNKEKLKKGFTLIEMMVVIAIIGILGTLIIPKVKLALEKARVSKVQGYRYESQNLIIGSLKLPNLTLKPISSNLLEEYAIKETPGFTYNGVYHNKTNQIFNIRTNTGGWIYDSVEGKLYVNLPNGAYTKDAEYERWDGEGPKYVATTQIPTSTGATTPTSGQPSSPKPAMPKTSSQGTNIPTNPKLTSTVAVTQGVLSPQPSKQQPEKIELNNSEQSSRINSYMNVQPVINHNIYTQNFKIDQFHQIIKDPGAKLTGNYKVYFGNNLKDKDSNEKIVVVEKNNNAHTDTSLNGGSPNIVIPTIDGSKPKQIGFSVEYIDSTGHKKYITNIQTLNYQK